MFATVLRSFRGAARVFAAVLALAVLAACGEEVPTSPGPATIAISLDPASATTEQGTTIMVTGSATVGGAFTGDVEFTVTGLPAGVTIAVGAIVPPTGGGSTFTVPITVAVGASVTPGTYSGTVTATGSGVTDETTYSLTVTAATSGTISLGSVSNVSVQQGMSDTRTVNITRDGGFTGDVALTVEGVPSNVTATADPASTSGASSTLTISVGAGAAPGTTTLTVRGSGSGVADATTSFDLTVTAAPSGSDIRFDYSSCTIDAQPLWVAFQDGAGSGTWVRVPETTVGSALYDVTVTQSTFGMAIVAENGSETQVAVGYWGLAQVEGGVEPGCVPVSTKTVGGNAVGLVGLTNVSFGGVGTPLFTDGAFVIGAVPEGIQDFIGYSANNMGGSDRMVISRDLDIMSGGSLGTIDFAAGFTPASATITLNGLIGSENGFAGMSYATSSAGSTCAVAPLYSGIMPAGGATTFTGRSAPVAEKMSDEYHVVDLTYTVGGQAKALKESFSTLADRTVDLPADVPVPTLMDVGSTAYLRLQADYVLDAEYDDLTSFSYTDGSNAVSLFATGDAMSTDASFTMPDFSAVDGWMNTWAVPATATGVQYAVTATGLSGLEPLCTDGGRQVQGTLTGAYN